MRFGQKVGWKCAPFCRYLYSDIKPLDEKGRVVLTVVLMTSVDTAVRAVRTVIAGRELSRALNEACARQAAGPAAENDEFYRRIQELWPSFHDDPDRLIEQAVARWTPQEKVT